jgi:hypothetical protein
VLDDAIGMPPPMPASGFSANGLASGVRWRVEGLELLQHAVSQFLFGKHLYRLLATRRHTTQPTPEEGPTRLQPLRRNATHRVVCRMPHVWQERKELASRGSQASAVDTQRFELHAERRPLLMPWERYAVLRL